MCASSANQNQKKRDEGTETVGDYIDIFSRINKKARSKKRISCCR